MSSGLRLASRAVALFLALAASACGNLAERARIQAIANETTTSVTACTERATENPKYASLKPKLYLGSANAIPPEYLTIATKPESHEVPLIQDLLRDVQPCRSMMLDGAVRMQPRVYAAAMEAHQSTDRLWADLIAGHITYGQFNNGRQDVTAQARRRIGSRSAD
jgi:hypothetical protein